MLYFGCNREHSVLIESRRANLGYKSGHWVRIAELLRVAMSRVCEHERCNDDEWTIFAFFRIEPSQRLTAARASPGSGNRKEDRPSFVLTPPFRKRNVILHRMRIAGPQRGCLFPGRKVLC